MCKFVQVLEGLPGHLAVLVLQEVFLAAPPCVQQIDPVAPRRGMLELYEWCEHWRAQKTMFALMDRLAPEHHALVLLAHRAVSGSRDAGALTLPLLRTQGAGCIAALAAEPPFSHVTSLCLEVTAGAWEIFDSCSWHVTYADILQMKSAPAPELDFRQIVAPLPTLRSLTHLCVDAMRGCESTRDWPSVPWAHDLSLALLVVLPQLTALESLSIRMLAWFPLAHGLAALTGLRALELSGQQLMPVGSRDQWAPAWVALRAALLVMPGLTSLNLLRSCLEDNGWRSIRDVVVKLKLESLNLACCGLTDAFSLSDSEEEDSEAAAHADADASAEGPRQKVQKREAPMRGLRSLMLPGNDFQRNQMKFLSQLVCLTELDLRYHGVYMDAVTHCHVLSNIMAPGLVKLRYDGRLKAQDWDLDLNEVSAPAIFPIAEQLASSLCGVFARCPMLEEVVLHEWYWRGTTIAQLWNAMSRLLHLSKLEMWMSNGALQPDVESTSEIEAHSDGLVLCAGLLELHIFMGLCTESVLGRISTLTRLQSLGIDWVEPNPRVCDAGCGGLSALVNLTRLHLYRACLTRAFAVQMAQALACMCQIKEVFVQTTGLPCIEEYYDNSGEYMCWGQDLRRLCNPRVRAEEEKNICSIAPLIDILPQLRSLSHLQVRKRYLLEEEVTALVTALPQLRALRILCFGSACPHDPEQVNAVQQRLTAAAPANVAVMHHDLGY